MPANDPRYGFRYATSNSHACPKPVAMLVATGQAFTPGSATAARLQPGDPVRWIAGGTIDHANAGETVWGIMAGVGHDGKVWNTSIGSGVMHPSTFIPSGVAYGTVLERQTIVLVVPALGYEWEIDADHQLADLAAWQAVVGQNADHAFDAPGAGDLHANPQLDTAIAPTGTGQWRITRVSPTGLNQDYTDDNVKLIVKVNEGQEAPSTALGI